ncbi:MAG: PorT family protein [Bacteroidales bacterium]|nr:PorT family protein [Bacteroidales bacterium]
MKKVFAFVAVAAALLVAGKANAQIGIHAGYAPQTYLSKYTTGNNTYTDTTKMGGFFVGADYNVNLSGDLNVSVGLQARYNTASDSVSASLFGLASGKVKRTNAQILVDVPILFNYGFNLTNDLKLSVFLGPTISYALSGKTTVVTSANVAGFGGSNTNEINWYKADEGNMNAFDLSGTIGVNLDFNGIRFFGGYNMGLMNLSKEDNTTMKGSNIFVGVGYTL